jgi:hypothetical protein
MNVEHPTINFEHRMNGPAVAEAMAGKKYTVDQDKVDRKFCTEKCNGWMAKTQRCGTFMAPDWRKNKCMFESPRLRQFI